MQQDEWKAPRDVTGHSVWQWLISRFPDRALTLETRLQEDLAIDSIQWIDITLEIGRYCGVELPDEAFLSTQTVGDLLHLARRSKSIVAQCVKPRSPIEDPEETLTEERRIWLSPLGHVELAAAWCIYALNCMLMRLLFRIRISGDENLAVSGPFVLAPHHTSYLDSLVLGAVLPFNLLKRSYWAAWTGIAFGSFFRVLRRLTHVVPVDVARGAVLSLAYGAAVLKGRHNLIWFPEGQISRAGEMLPLKPGLGLLLARYPAPVVLVNIEGTREALPYGHRVPRPGRVRIAFSQPLDSRDLERTGEGAEPHQRITDALHKELARFCVPANYDRLMMGNRE
jgi:long-chain acyl-CoA synthetase